MLVEMESIFHRRPLQHYPVQASGGYKTAHPHMSPCCSSRAPTKTVWQPGHNVEWPPRSPDLTPCDFFLWGYLKGKVFTTPPNDLNDLRNRIQQEVETLRNNPQTVTEAVQEMLKALCLEREGGHVEGVGV